MSMKTTLKDAMKEAMRAKDKPRLKRYSSSPS